MSEVRSLMDLCAERVASTQCWESIEIQCSASTLSGPFLAPVPTPIQERIAFYSFPKHVQDIRLYSSLRDDSSEGSFKEGMKLYEAGAVTHAVQTGYSLNGCVKGPPMAASTAAHLFTETYNVSIRVDRCRITTAHCSCSNQGVKTPCLCPHMVALSLHRINRGKETKVHSTATDLLSSLNREQLTRLVLTLIDGDHSLGRATTNIVVSILGTKNSAVVRDPTAGAPIGDRPMWKLDENVIRKETSACLSALSGSTSSNLMEMFKKVRAFLARKDCNGPKMLAAMTSEFMAVHKARPWRYADEEEFGAIWRELDSLWTCVMLGPSDWPGWQDDKANWYSLLQKWSKDPECPLSGGGLQISKGLLVDEEGDDEKEASDGDDNEVGSAAIAMRGEKRRAIAMRRGKRRGFVVDRPASPRTMFQSAIEANSLTWDGANLSALLAGNQLCRGKHGQPSVLFLTESLPVACARVDALRSHGHITESSRLVVATARTLIHRIDFNACSAGSRKPDFMDNVLLLFNALLDMSRVAETVDPSANSGDNPSYKHVLVPVSEHDSALFHGAVYDAAADEERLGVSVETYVTRQTFLRLATEVALVGLCSISQTPSVCPMTLARMWKNQMKIVGELKLVPKDDCLREVTELYIGRLVDGYSGLFGVGEPTTEFRFPMFPLAKFAFEVLWTTSPDLAFRVGLRGCRYSALQGAPLPDGLSLLTLHQAKVEVHHHHQRELILQMLPVVAEQQDHLQRFKEVVVANVVDLRYMLNIAIDLCSSASLRNGRRSLAVYTASYDLGVKVLTLSRGEASSVRQKHVCWFVDCVCAIASTIADIAFRDQVVNMLQSQGLQPEPQQIPMETELEGQQIHQPSAPVVMDHTQARHQQLGVGLNPRNRYEPDNGTAASNSLSARWNMSIDPILEIISDWTSLFTEVEATAFVIPKFVFVERLRNPSLFTGTGLHLTEEQEQQVIRKCYDWLKTTAELDPNKCALATLQLSGRCSILQGEIFSYLTKEGTSVLTPAVAFKIAHYMSDISRPIQALAMVDTALKTLSIGILDDESTLVNDLHWACTIAASQGSRHLEILTKKMAVAVENPDILASLMNRLPIVTLPPVFAMGMVVSGMPGMPGMPGMAVKPAGIYFDDPAVQVLLDASMRQYQKATHLKMRTISPRHYSSFIDFLGKARDLFLQKGGNGMVAFTALLDQLCTTNRGKKKLVSLIRERFC